MKLNYLWHHLQSILAAYNGGLPLHHFLRGYFAQHKKLGSRDRRGLSDAAYAWYRCAKAIGCEGRSFEEQVIAALYLCGLRPKAFISAFPQTWLPQVDGHERLQTLGLHDSGITLKAIFPLDIPFSAGITADQWRASMLLQPRLFLRIRQDASHVDALLETAGISREWITSSCLALPNGIDAERLLPPRSYVVQDASSQAVGDYMNPAARGQWWDCCCGAGGKSLMLLDAAPGVDLTATDIRGGILQNLSERFTRYGFPLPENFVLDAGDANALTRMGERRFDGIICDVPCTGSGTWARTPEGCFFFNSDSLAAYAMRQKSILRNAARHLKPAGRLIYITCSVFRAENEDVIAEVAPASGLRVLKAALLNGISKRADSLFVAELGIG